MTSDTPLPPHLKRFLHDQVASGRFPSAGEVIRTALQLLEAATATPPSRPRPSEGVTATGSGAFEYPAVVERWQSPAEWRAGSVGKVSPPPSTRRSPRGLLADLRSDITPDDIRDARGELWGGLAHRSDD